MDLGPMGTTVALEAWDLMSTAPTPHVMCSTIALTQSISPLINTRAEI